MIAAGPLSVREVSPLHIVPQLTYFWQVIILAIQQGASWKSRCPKAMGFNGRCHFLKTGRSITEGSHSEIKEVPRDPNHQPTIHMGGLGRWQRARVVILFAARKEMQGPWMQTSGQWNPVMSFTHRKHTSIPSIPVVPHKAAAEVWKIGKLK